MATEAVKDTRGYWKPGCSGNPAGKPKGAVSKINRSIKDMILTALHDVGGAQFLARQAEQNPVAFMALVGRVLPLQVAGHDGGKLEVEFRWRDEEPTRPTIEAEPELASDSSPLSTWAGGND